MKRKVQLSELVEELKRENLMKRDLIVPSHCLSMVNGRISVTNVSSNREMDIILKDAGISNPNGGKRVLGLDCMPVFHSNLSDKLGIPKKYYDKMNTEDDRGLLDQNVSHWFENKDGNYFLRSFINNDEKKGYARALLSDRFKVIDNYDVLFACLEAVKASGANVNIEYCDITEKKMYVRFIAPDIEIDAPELLKNYRVPDGGDKGNGKTGICTGFVMSNSEVGQGQFSISPRAVVGACSNGMIFKDDAFQRTHLGSRMEEGAIDWSDKTKEKNQELIIAQVQDAIRTFCSEEYLGKRVTQLQDKGSGQLENPLDTVKNVTNFLSIPESKERDIMNYFVHSGDFTGFGVTQALTYYAHNDANADDQYELEMAGVQVLDKISEFDKPTVKKGKRTQARLN